MTPTTCHGWTLDGLVAGSPNMKQTAVVESTLPVDKLVLDVASLLDDGVPVMVSGYDQHSGWDSSLFSLRSVRSDFRDSTALVRNLDGGEPSQIDFASFLDSVDRLSGFAGPADGVRCTATDIVPPTSWRGWLAGDRNGGTSVLPKEFLPLGSDDLFAHMPKKARAETLLCYFGPGDAPTSWYKDPCGSIVQNLMCHAPHDSSAFWFMVATADAHKASSHFQQQGYGIDHDDPPPFIPPEELKRLPFDVYVCQQKRGDLVILPPRCNHQVIRCGGLSGSLAWSRITISSIIHALHLELPIYNRVLREEIYRVKLTLWYASLHHASLSPPNTGLLDELLDLLDTVIIDEWSPEVYSIAPSSVLGEEFLTCDYCMADIFVSFFECPDCGDGDSLVFCPLCYASGRTCSCVSGMRPSITKSFGDLEHERNRCARVLTAHGMLIPELTDRRIRNARGLKTFQAACEIYRRRLSGNTGVCNLGESEHQPAAGEAIAYSNEPTFACFSHINDRFSFHSVRAAILSAEAVVAGPADDIHGRYLNVVVKKYHQSGEPANSSTISGWYDRDDGNREADDQEATEVAITSQALLIAQRARKACADPPRFPPVSCRGDLSPSLSNSTGSASVGPADPVSPEQAPSAQAEGQSHLPLNPDDLFSSSPLSSPSPQATTLLEPEPVAELVTPPPPVSTATIAGKSPISGIPISIPAGHEGADMRELVRVRDAPPLERSVSTSKRTRLERSDSAEPASKRRRALDTTPPQACAFEDPLDSDGPKCRSCEGMKSQLQTLSDDLRGQLKTLKDQLLASQTEAESLRVELREARQVHMNQPKRTTSNASDIQHKAGQPPPAGALYPSLMHP